MKSDIQIQKDVMDELKWDPLLNSAEIGVAVKRGIVTLSGQVDSYAKKIAAEKDALKIAGVKALADDMTFGVSPFLAKTDAEVAEAAVAALKWHSSVPDEKVTIKVENGNVYLDGEVDWEYQRASAKIAIENLVGVKAVINYIKIKPHVVARDVHEKIVAALKRTASIDADKIKVETVGDKVVLKGRVRSSSEREDAEHAAWSAPGVTGVDDRLEIEEPEFSYED
ncbi:BON domain-containing protein [Pollutibacter soli]|uniref:BON domain-containing protein n=1 Tax=Pollutibacter soli TaxID=3034157 RepID=UPI00301386CC